MRSVNVRQFFIGLIGALLIATPCLAQSLDIHSATALRPGDNHGTIDNQTGAQFWALHYGAGAGKIQVSFTSMGIFGNPMKCTVGVVVMTPDGKILARQQLTSVGQPAQLSWPGNFAHAGVWIIEIQPMASNIVRNGGDYVINVSGPAIAGGGPAAAPNPAEVVGTYAVMVCPPDFQCDSGLAIRFAPDGGVVTTDGHSGHWTLFDPDARVYTVVVGRDHWTLKLVPGRGLMDTHDQSIVVFQSVRR
jgi:hypothetical protein